MWSSYKRLPIVPIGALSAETSRTPTRPQYPTATRDPGWPRSICSALTKHFAWQSVHSAAPHSILPTHGENKLRTKWPQRITQCSILSRGLTFLSSAEEREEERKKNTQYNAASRKASRRIARAPRLSCLYKQALIFLSSSGTSAIYSQPRGRGPAGLEKFCYSPVRPLRPVCENRFHL